jgi:hypothetical protein
LGNREKHVADEVDEPMADHVGNQVAAFRTGLTPTLSTHFALDAS